jgi:hypothetical protein
MSERKTVFTVADRITQANARLPILEKILLTNLTRFEPEKLTAHTVETVMKTDPSLAMTIHRYLEVRSELASLASRNPNEIA